MDSIRINFVPTESLAADPSNARTHSKKQIGQIARSIEKFGFNNPILIDLSGKVVAGHGRLLAAQQLRIENVPTIRLDHLNPHQLKAYALADNRIAELAGWDREILAVELQGLLELDLDFEITDVGFEMAEIDLILDEARVNNDTPDTDDVIPEPDEIPGVARMGDLWRLGEHLLFCGDALDSDSYRILMGEERAQLVFTDPPYNVPVKGHVSGLGRTRHREFIQASGEMSRSEFSQFLHTAGRNMRAASVDGSIHFICMDWRHISELIEAGRSVYSELKNICVWVKPNGGMGSLYRSRHEMVAVFKAGEAQHQNNVQLGVLGRYRTNVWEYEGMNSFQTGWAIRSVVASSMIMPARVVN